MSKRDFEAIAGKFWELRPISAIRTAPGSDWARAIDGIADVLASANPRFDRNRFITACETGEMRLPKSKAKRLTPEQDGSAYNPEPEVA